MGSSEVRIATVVTILPLLMSGLISHWTIFQTEVMMIEHRSRGNYRDIRSILIW